MHCVVLLLTAEIDLSLVLDHSVVASSFCPKSTVRHVVVVVVDDTCIIGLVFLHAVCFVHSRIVKDISASRKTLIQDLIITAGTWSGVE